MNHSISLSSAPKVALWRLVNSLRSQVSYPQSFILLIKLLVSVRIVELGQLDRKKLLEVRGTSYCNIISALESEYVKEFDALRLSKRCIVIVI